MPCQPWDGAGQQWTRVAMHGLTGTLSNGSEISEHSCIPWQPGCWATTLADRCWGADAPAPLIGAMARGGLEAARASAGRRRRRRRWPRDFGVILTRRSPKALAVMVIFGLWNLNGERFLTCGHCARFVLRVQGMRTSRKLFILSTLKRGRVGSPLMCLSVRHN